jgi:hypothetical protein
MSVSSHISVQPNLKIRLNALNTNRESFRIRNIVQGEAEVLAYFEKH